MSIVSYELGRAVIRDDGQTYSWEKATGTLRVCIEGRSGRVQWRTIKDKRRIRRVLNRAMIPLTREA